MAEAPAQFAVGQAPAIRGERAGEGRPLALCHGITATRRYVLHGSRALEREGYDVISYDARGHGESDPAPPGQGYGYPELVADLERVLDSQAGGAAPILLGHSMGAHTIVAHALAHPGRAAALVVIGPVYAGEIPAGALDYWDGLAAALEAGGVDGFVGYVDRNTGTGPAWRDSVLRFTRERMERHRDLGAMARALREVPRSRPFGGLEELEAIDVPALVVASRDEADPGHPYAVAEEYAGRLPRATLVAEPPGSSPLAWQGGRLSREIARFCAGLAEPQE